MRYGFVLSRQRGQRFCWLETCVVSEVSGTENELAKRLHGWGLDVIAEQELPDGCYAVDLVELDEHGNFDTYLALVSDDIIWFHETEYVPAG